MFQGLSVLAVAPVLDEREKIGLVIDRVPRQIADEVLVVDDGSTDGSDQVAEERGATVIRLGATIGVGAALRAGFDYAMNEGYDVVVVMAGNNKDWPEEMEVLLEPISEGRAGLVQGSRYLHETPDWGAMPFYRKVATRLHPMLFGLVAGQRMSDTTNGYRAISSRVLKDENLDLTQPWLDEYELEVYLLYKAIKLGHGVVEVPVKKTYPPKSAGQTKMKPVVGWWSILRPIVLLGFGIKR